MKQPPEPAPRCEACRRPRFKGPAMARIAVPDAGLVLLCVDEADCRRHWAVDTYPYLPVRS